jgi:hypothetical protein
MVFYVLVGMRVHLAGMFMAVDMHEVISLQERCIFKNYIRRPESDY